MADNDSYLTPEERARMQQPPTDDGLFIMSRPDASAKALIASHAETDRVMHLLVDALRELTCECTWCSHPEYRGPCAESRARDAALAEYDRLTGGSDD